MIKTSIKINLTNLEHYYNDIKGNLYYKYPNEKEYQVMDGFSLKECKQAIKNGVEFIWIKGPAL